MRSFIASFASGVWLLQQQAALPTWSSVVALLLGAVVLWRPGARGVWRVTLLAGLAAGFAWAAANAKLRMADWLSAEMEGRDVAITGVVASLPQSFARGQRFHFDVEAADDTRLPARVALSWYDNERASEPVPPIRAGERWRFTVRLKRPRGTANPHTFDYEAWLLERGIGATGYVRSGEPHERLSALVPRPAYLIERAREHIRDRFHRLLPGERYTGVLVALAIGDQRAIDPADWQLYIRTGVGHLMSISGLHVTMVSGLGAALVYRLWCLFPPLLLWLPARKAAAVGAVLTGLAYCLLAGFGVPAQRTLYMLSVVAAAVWLDRMQSSSRILLLALFAVLLGDPWAVVSPGFWLSFGAVSLMLYVGLLQGRVHWLLAWTRVQWAITLGLAPVLLVLFQQVSLVSPLANAVAIPAVSLVVTPLSLLAAVLPGAWCAQLAHLVLIPLMELLALLDRLPAAVWEQHAPPVWALMPALVGVAWLLAPRGMPARYLGVLLLLPLYALPPQRPAHGALWLDVLDVGQGLAVVLRTARHTLLYDAGPTYGSDADAGGRMVLPWLRGMGVNALDVVMISHEDNDHVGGAATVLDRLSTGMLWSSLPNDHPLLSQARLRLPCRGGAQWEWDGVRFELLHPLEQAYARLTRSNSRSCVLRVISAHGRALLTGDIEAGDEQALLARAAPLRAEVLLAPHHGSRTSSTAAFLRAVAPQYVVFSNGYRNRFGHPHPAVAARYEAVGAHAWRTDQHGAVSVRLEAAGATVQGYRQRVPRYWRSLLSGEEGR